MLLLFVTILHCWNIYLMAMPGSPPPSPVLRHSVRLGGARGWQRSAGPMPTVQACGIAASPFHTGCDLKQTCLGLSFIEVRQFSVGCDALGRSPGQAVGRLVASLPRGLNRVPSQPAHEHIDQISSALPSRLACDIPDIHQSC